MANNAHSGRSSSFIALADCQSNTNLCWAKVTVKNISQRPQTVSVSGIVTLPKAGVTSGLVASNPSAPLLMQWTSGSVVPVPSSIPAAYVMGAGAVLIVGGYPGGQSEKCLVEGIISVKEDVGAIYATGVLHQPTGGREMAVPIEINSGRPF